VGYNATYVQAGVMPRNKQVIDAGFRISRGRAARRLDSDNANQNRVIEQTYSAYRQTARLQSVMASRSIVLSVIIQVCIYTLRSNRAKKYERPAFASERSKAHGGVQKIQRVCRATVARKYAAERDGDPGYIKRLQVAGAGALRLKMHAR